MLKGLFGKSSGDAPRGREIDLDRIGTLIEFFPIGRKLRYFPEFHQDIVLDTLVVAYCVNGHFLYSMESIEMDRSGLPSLFRADDGRFRLPAAGLRNFQLLVPDTSYLEKKLDYTRRARIGHNGQFAVGNSISLISNAGMKGVSTIDTEVARQVLLPDGPYAHSNMILLTPDFATLSVTDQRRKPRARTNVPVTVILSTNEALSGTLVDISEAKVRLRLEERGPMPSIRRDDDLRIEFHLGESERRYSLQGSVLRGSAGTCVVALAGQIVSGQIVPFSDLDLLELKAGLLNYGR
ncbi:MAG: PilZ domain-containing protein [Candidatus Accumulibacter sp.]|jgi:hypothetical protein|nr:PilZ domain-containing protein [Accumulibacter sp.]